jgi:hypothetical protein
MAKKSQSGRGKPMPQQAKGAAHKPQAPERASTATLVRAPGSAPSETPSASNIVAETTPVAPARQPAARPAPSARPTERKAAVAERSAPPKPATPQPAAPQPATRAAPAARKPAPTPTREQNQRLVRARATQRARQANLISAEHYSYVLGDLKLVLALAISALVVLIALTFVLPH